MITAAEINKALMVTTAEIIIEITHATKDFKNLSNLLFSIPYRSVRSSR